MPQQSEDQEGYARWSRHLPTLPGEVAGSTWPRAQYATPEGIEALRLKVAIERRSVAAKRAAAVERALLCIPGAKVGELDVAPVPGSGLRIRSIPSEATSDSGRRARYDGWWLTHASGGAPGSAAQAEWTSLSTAQEWADWQKENPPSDQGLWLKVERRDKADTSEASGFIIDSKTVSWQLKLLHPQEMCELWLQHSATPTEEGAVDEKLQQLRDRLDAARAAAEAARTVPHQSPRPSRRPRGELSAEECARADDFFARLDADGDGMVRQSELLDALRVDATIRELFALPSEVEGNSADYARFRQHWVDMDANADDGISQREFLDWFSSCEARDSTEGIPAPSAPPPDAPRLPEQDLEELCEQSVIATLTREDLTQMARDESVAVRLGMCHPSVPGAPPGSAPPFEPITDSLSDRPPPLSAVLNPEPAHCQLEKSELANTGDPVLAALWPARAAAAAPAGLSVPAPDAPPAEDRPTKSLLRRLCGCCDRGAEAEGQDVAEIAPEMWIVACIPDRGPTGTDPCVVWPAGRPRWVGRTRLLARVRDAGGGVFVAQPPLSAPRSGRPYALPLRVSPGSPDIEVYRYCLCDEQPATATAAEAAAVEVQAGQDYAAVEQRRDEAEEGEDADAGGSAAARGRLQMLDRVIRQAAREMTAATREAPQEGVGPPFSAEPQYNEMRVHYFGELIGARGFESKALFIRFVAQLPEVSYHDRGSAWWRHDAPVTGADHQADAFAADSTVRFTQTARPVWTRREDGMLVSSFTFSMPWSLHCLAACRHDAFGATYPRLLLQIYSDWSPGSGASPAQLLGYTHLDLSPVPGTHRRVLPCWKPVHSIRQHLREHFLGGSPELEDLSYVAVPSGFKEDFLNKFGFHVTSVGEVDLRWNCVVQSCSRYSAGESSDAWMADYRPAHRTPAAFGGAVGQDRTGRPFFFSSPSRRRLSAAPGVSPVREVGISPNTWLRHTQQQQMRRRMKRGESPD
eukprot:TRINITY_DN3169_c0_g1_i1.p1 TRINITY_DN3169_c0_g1~~TRINITY_DN3169_c0_g1_i1.p1  ORF type:complete len:977 (+),score=226.92 TRINITY_DN3169_c0_g1_i1:83-3013(+)